MDPSIWSKLHGAATHFPIALMVFAALCESASLLCNEPGRRHSCRFAATVAMVLGALGSYAAIVTGLVMTRGQMWGHATMLRHHQFVWPAFILATGLATWRVVTRAEPSPAAAAAQCILVILTAALMSVAGFWGGELFHEG